MTGKKASRRFPKPVAPADVAVVGGGAAGLFCAMESARRGRRTVVLEHNASVGRKISVAGGGRCNFTNLNVSPRDYRSDNPDFPKSALSRFHPEDFISILDRHRIQYEERESGRMFLKESASRLAEVLEKECLTQGGELLTSCPVLTVTRNGKFELKTGFGMLSATKLVIAAGGCARPDLGAADFGLRVAAAFRLKVIPPAPALAGLRWDSSDLQRYKDLAGISFDSAVTCGKTRFQGAVLFTHGGLSGPAIMNATLVWRKGMPLEIDLAPGNSLVPESSRNDPPGLGQMRAGDILARFVPGRLARRLAVTFAPDSPVARWTTAQRRAFEKTVHMWRVTPAAVEGYDKAEVMRGGLDTRELSSKTMESLKVPGLYFVGEVLDVTGKVGGFNLHWAWASGFAAGSAV